MAKFLSVLILFVLPCILVLLLLNSGVRCRKLTALGGFLDLCFVYCTYISKLLNRKIQKISSSYHLVITIIYE